MEINKISFENLKDLSITQSFEDLDVNKDGVIDEKDKSSTKNADIANVISNLLNNVDEEAELIDIAKETKTIASKSSEKTSSNRNSYGILETDANSFDTDVTNSKGTVYVVMGNLTSCSYCRKLQSEIKDNLSELESVASVYSLDWDENNSLGWEIYRKSGQSDDEAIYPTIAKFVDGQFVELISDARNASQAVKNMLEKVEGTKSSDGTSETTETDGTSETDGSTGTSTTDSTTDTKSSTDKTTSTLTDEEKAKLAELKEELAALNKKIDEINADIKTLQEANKALEETKAKLETEQAAAQEEADKANAKLEEEQAKLDTYTKEYDNYQNELDDANREILKEQNREEEEYNDSVNTLVNKAINDYDPTNDGDDFDAYFAKKMDSAGLPIFTKLDNLNSEAQNLSDNAAIVLGNIKMQSSIVSTAKRAADAANNTLTEVTNKLNNTIEEINANNTKIKSLNTDLTTTKEKKTEVQAEIDEILPVEGGGLTGAEVLAKIPDKEKQLCKDNNIDLTTCNVAMGEDGIFHIYQSDGTSVVRAYASNQGFSESDSAYIQSGSGYMRNLKEATEGNGRAVYTFTSVNECLTEGECDYMAGCYCTCSPLSFDVAGDGVNTTNETVSFDIDGDGELDTVNNSDEWVLAFDKDGNGKAGENGSELFGDNTDLDGDGKADGYKNGFEALKALAKKEGLIGENDTKLDEADIKKLSDKYGLTMTNGYGGENKSLADIGITEINLASTDETTLTKNFDGRNNDIMTQEGATFVVNGESREYADIWNAKKDSSEAVTKESSLEMYDTVTARLANTDVKLELNQHGVVALNGNVDFKNIKNTSMNKAEVPDNIFEEIIEVKDEEEIEE